MSSPHGGDGSALDQFGGHVRVRVGALLVDDDRQPGAILLAEHAGLWDDDPFWTPPGGGVDVGEGLAEALHREVKEETGLDVEVGPLRYVLDFVRPPLHAVSFYFSAALCAGSTIDDLGLGGDPELAHNRQLLRSVRFVSFDTLGSLRVYPEPFQSRLAGDVRAGFPDGALYLGTFR